MAQKLVASGHAVNRANSKRPETIRDLACDLGATAASKEEAVQGVEAIVLAIPSGKYPDLAGKLAARRGFADAVRKPSGPGMFGAAMWRGRWRH
ncbi:NAD(P)-binding domain-containing protein [Mesorhizobium sp. B2-6-4]|uniref:NAD(P)-binding domain-containing protein n=1 Tax=Mesorhizobium sp. B2-6-4 TaxID=2589913 RepID=UPI001FEF7822|nr:NAD(P)-binding domain-containing protein [Mesorhizobium sp. B2-6-4]